MTVKEIRRSIMAGKVMIVADIVDDAGNLIVGGVCLEFDTDPTVDDLLAAAQAFVPASSSTGDATARELLDRREQLKWQTVRYMQNNPAGSLADMTSNMSWDDIGLVNKLIKLYAYGAAERGVIPQPEDTPEGCFAALNVIVQNSTNEQLAEMLRDIEV